MDALTESLHKLQGSLDFARRDIGEAYKKACTESPLVAMLLLPMIGEIVAIENRVVEIIANLESDTDAEIVKLCQQYAHPGCNPGAHELACKILKLLGDREGVAK